MTPMIDMTFQLIAFFMIVSNFEQMQADERVRLPVDQMAVPPESPRPDDIVVNIGYNRDKDGVKTSDEPYLFYGDDQIPLLNTADYFTREKRRQEAIQQPLEDVTIVIRADKDVPTGLIQEMMRIAQEAGFSRFSLKAQQGEEDLE